MIALRPHTPRPSRRSILFALILLALACPLRLHAAEAKHLVIVVMDGLRPDSVTQQDMPTLYKLAQEGTTFARHHCVYPSSTEVNGVARPR